MSLVRVKSSVLYQRPKWAGFSLVDLLISLFLGVILSWTAAEVYLASVRSYLLKVEMANIQNNGRFALAVLRRELMQVGFLGGASTLSPLESKAVSRDCVNSGAWALDTAVPMDFVNDFGIAGARPFATAAGRELSCLTAGDVMIGTDILSIKRTAGDYTVRNGSYASSATARDMQWYLRLHNDEATAQWIFHSAGGFVAADLGNKTGIDYWQYQVGVYYIRRYSQTASDQIPSLCAERLGGGSSAGVMATQCLAEGVEDMQFEFGVDSNGDGVSNYFREALSSNELSNVVTVRVFLLLRSLVEVSAITDERTFYLGSKQVSSSDGYLRRVMSTTVRTTNLLVARG
jgi:type IV pilus assembly protein PilW